jgi:thiol-disulfide isomerase/thioredoxin
MVAPILKDLAKEYGDSIVIYKIDTDKEKELAMAMGIQSLPTIVFIPQTGQPQVIVGAADKATGTSERNKELSLRRAEYISELLQKRDVPKEQITTEGIGGVSKFKPEDINRYTRVLLYQTH